MGEPASEVWKVRGRDEATSYAWIASSREGMTKTFADSELPKENEAVKISLAERNLEVSA